MSKYKYTLAWNSKLHSFSHGDKAVLLAEVMGFMRKNNINYNESDVSTGIDRQSSIHKKKAAIGLSAAVSGAKAVLKYTSGQAASNEEIHRRSAICAGCPLISKIGGCGPCGAAGKIANFVSSIRVTLKLQEPIPTSVRSAYCGVCDCSLALMVPSKMDAFDEPASQNGMRPDICWVKKNSINYIP